MQTSPEITVKKMLEVAQGIQTGRTRWVVMVFCLENGEQKTEAGLLVPGQAEGGVATTLRHGADPAERARCVREIAERLEAAEAQRLGLPL